MRTTVQLSLLLAVCALLCWVFSIGGLSKPAVISGQVVDWNTGRPAPFADVRMDQPNSSVVVARTDAQGKFRFQPSAAPNLYFLFAGRPRWGRLLQTTFGQTVVLYRKSQQVHDVVIPAIPATEISGHVYGSDGKPLAACDVSAFTRDGWLDAPPNLFAEGWRFVMAWERAAADDPNKFMEGEIALTDNEGRYAFRELGADPYFVAVRCSERQARKMSTDVAWAPRLFPNARSVNEAEQIVLRPGDQRRDIDFHLSRKRSYSLEGKIILSDHSVPKPWPQAIYSQDLIAMRSDRALTSTWIGRENCQIDTNAGTFRCPALLSGEYTFYFGVAAGLGASSNLPTQSARVKYIVPVVGGQSLTVQLGNVSAAAAEERQYAYRGGEGGSLAFGKTCQAVSDGRPAIQVVAWGSGHASGSCYFRWFSGDTRLLLPKGRYTVNAFEAAFRSPTHGNISKFERLLKEHGRQVEVGNTAITLPPLPVLTTSELIQLALSSLEGKPLKPHHESRFEMVTR